MGLTHYHSRAATLFPSALGNSDRKGDEDPEKMDKSGSPISNVVYPFSASTASRRGRQAIESVRLTLPVVDYLCAQSAFLSSWTESQGLVNLSDIRNLRQWANRVTQIKDRHDGNT